jgi:hypothetical protein
MKRPCCVNQPGVIATISSNFYPDGDKSAVTMRTRSCGYVSCFEPAIRGHCPSTRAGISSQPAQHLPNIVDVGGLYQIGQTRARLINAHPRYSQDCGARPACPFDRTAGPTGGASIAVSLVAINPGTRRCCVAVSCFRPCKVTLSIRCPIRAAGDSPSKYAKARALAVRSGAC